jgi:soluble lytic murein transglycosylase-like protein
VQDAFDIGQNIEGGVRHLRGLLDRYNGNVALALAAYNAGAEAVARHGGILRRSRKRRRTSRGSSSSSDV